MTVSDPTVARDRFWEKVLRPDEGCWTWTGAVTKGYGSFRVNGKSVAAHRFAFTDQVGPIPDGMTVDHCCFNTLCMNPHHLRLLSLADNSRNLRKYASGRCKNGHEYTPENTYRYRGRRQCRACNREAVRRYRTSRSRAGS